MKHNLETGKIVKYGTIILLNLLFTFMSFRVAYATLFKQALQSRIVSSNNLFTQRNSSLSNEEKIKRVIETYFALRFEGQKFLVAQDFSALIENGDLEWVKNEKDKREIELYIAKLFNLKYQSYTYTLDYNSIEIVEGKSTVRLLESHSVVFESVAPKVSEFANNQHLFILHNKKGAWVIYKDTYSDDLSRQLASMKKEDIKRQVLENYNIYQRQIPINDNLDIPVVLPSNVFPYNRSAAVSYANLYAYSTGPVPQAVKNAYAVINNGSPYPNAWPQKYKREKFNGVGVDCTNFVSQAIFAGIKYTSGDVDYFYPDPMSSNWNWYYKFSPTVGGSRAWKSVGYLYSFLISNTERGPFGGPFIHSLDPICNLNIGDPVFMRSGTSWMHAVIITSKGTPCTPANIFVNAHDNNAKGVPLTNYSSYKWYGVKILGYRK